MCVQAKSRPRSSQLVPCGSVDNWALIFYYIPTIFLRFPVWVPSKVPFLYRLPVECPSCHTLATAVADSELFFAIILSLNVKS